MIRTQGKNKEMRTQIILNSIACALIALSMIVRNCERAEEREKASALREANERLEAEVALREKELAALSGTKGERLEPGDGDRRPVDEAERVHGHGNAAGVGDDENGGRVAEGLASVDDLRDGAGPVRIGCETTNLVVSATAQDVADDAVEKRGSGDEKRAGGDDFGSREVHR